jgi:flagellar hook-length control protein FliK
MPVPLDTLAVHIARKVEQGLNQFEITLTPAELGKLDISLRISDDGRVQAVLRAERQDTLDLLRQDARVLESQLRQAGLDVNTGALSFHLSQGNAHRYRQDNADFASTMMQDKDESVGNRTATAWIATRKRDGIDIHV